MTTLSIIPGYEIPIQLNLEEGLLVIDGENFTCQRLMDYVMSKGQYSTNVFRHCP